MDSSLDLVQRLTAQLAGPMNFRFILQPVMAILLGVRDGVQDARAGKAPFISDLIRRPAGRRRHFNETLERLAMPLVVAIVLDGIVQYLLFHHVLVIGAIVFGVTIMGLPFSIARGLTNRIMSARRRASGETHPMRG